MNDSDIPILKKAYDLYRIFHTYRRVVPKAERFTLYERCENAILDTIEAILEAGYSKSAQKLLVLERASVKLNIVRFFVRLLKETHSIDMKKYTMLQEMVDEIGRMLGGWIRSTGPR
ncbi:diversity-generating retroelement protein Avd [bacterium]|nr:MAG: diversity-generating retroelement protein Avd [bacterium]